MAKCIKRPEPTPPIIFLRADSVLFAKFDASTKICMMNCGKHRDDPRTRDELKFLCDDCMVRRAT